MHTAGFWHEQSRADRDKFITVHWDNIKPGWEPNFLKYDLRKIDHLGAEYDPCSVMHYGPYAFTKVECNRTEPKFTFVTRQKSGSPTIKTKKKIACELGQRSGLSDTDVR